jgi:GntR family transcriptional regulator
MINQISQYLRIYELLRRQIEEHEYPVGSFLPPEPELCKIFSVSRTTIRKTIEMLIDEGFVYVHRGRGTEILDFKATQKLQFITSFSETLKEQGFDVSYRRVTVGSVSASASVATDLKVATGDRLVLVHRIALANGKPIAIMDNHLIPDVVPGIEEKIAKIKSLYAFLESEYNVLIDAATDFISAKAATGEEAALLEVLEGSPLLVVRRVTYSGTKAVERADLVIVANRYEYSVRTKERPIRPLGTVNEPGIKRRT